MGDCVVNWRGWDTDGIDIPIQRTHAIAPPVPKTWAMLDGCFIDQNTYFYLPSYLAEPLCAQTEVRILLAERPR